MTSFRIALRYLFAPKSHKVVNVISIISIAGVAVATMAIVVVLSVFNGFSGLAYSHLSSVDPEARVVPVHGKTIEGADSLALVLESLPEVAVAMPALEERALLVTPDAQAPVIVRGVDPSRAGRVADLNAIFIDGEYVAGNRTDSPEGNAPLYAFDSTACVQLSVGVAVSTGLRPSSVSYADLYMPRRLGRINPSNPAAAYRQLPVLVTGVFRVDQPEYDTEYVFAPLSDVRRLLDYASGEASAIDVRPKAGVCEGELLQAVQSVLDSGLYDVLGRDRQHPETYRMIAVEKWVTFLMLVFILVIASFNIVSTLSLMVIEKKDNMATLRALGATRRSVTNVFVTLGWLITASGGLIGIASGVVLSLLQQHLGIIKLAGDPSSLTIDVYPVHLEWTDVGLVFVTVVAVGFAVGQIARVFTRKIK